MWVMCNEDGNPGSNHQPVSARPRRSRCRRRRTGGGFDDSVLNGMAFIDDPPHAQQRRKNVFRPLQGHDPPGPKASCPGAEGGAPGRPQSSVTSVTMPLTGPGLP